MLVITWLIDTYRNVQPPGVMRLLRCFPNLWSFWLEPLPQIAALRLHGFVPRAPWDRRKNWYVSWGRRSHGDLGVSTKLNGVPTAFYLASVCASHGTHAALTALCFAFGGSWNNWQGSHIAAQSWIHDSDNASTFNILPATLEPKGYYALGYSYVFVSEWYSQRLHHPASVKPRIGKHYLRLMVHISNG